MKIEFTDPNPKISSALEKKLLSKQKRLQIVKELEKKGIVNFIKADPAYYVVNLNHYGGQAFVNLEGLLLGHVVEYQADSEITEDDIRVIDEKLSRLHPDFFFAPMNNSQRKNGVSMMVTKFNRIKQDDEVGSINIRFPDADMVQIDMQDGKILRKHRGCLWSYECPGDKLPVFIQHQIDTQLVMLDDIRTNFTTDKYNKMFKYQVSVTEMWRETSKKMMSNLPDSYWKDWQERTISIPTTKTVKE